MGAFEDEAEAVHTQDVGDIAAQILQKDLETRGFQQAQDGAVDLVRPGEVLIGGGDHGAVSILEPVEPGLETRHGDPAQIHDIRPQRPVPCGDKGTHHIGIVEKQRRILQDCLAQAGFDLGARGHEGGRPSWQVSFSLAQGASSGQGAVFVGQGRARGAWRGCQRGGCPCRCGRRNIA